jgi:hypothetical protein
VGVPLLRYQWQLDGAALSGATNASLTITNVQAKDTGGYRVIVVSPLGAATSVTAQVTIPFNTDLAAALNTSTRQWATTNFAGSAQPWFAQIRETHDGNVAAQSGRISDNQQSVLYTPSVGPGTLTFWWKVSSEAGYDFLKFLVDGSVVASISGETGWQQKTIAIPADFHALKWVYTKDASVSSGQDAGWLDEFVFTLAPMIVVQPTNQIAWMGQDVVIWPYVGGPAPLSYQWLKAGIDMPDATQLNLTLPRVTRRDSGAYALRVTNPGGSVTSSNATLKVIVQQRLGPIRLAADGSIELLSRDVDDGLLLPEDLPAFEVLASTNLVDWETLPNAQGLTNGALLLRDLNGTSFPKRFYRVLEH